VDSYAALFGKILGRRTPDWGGVDLEGAKHRIRDLEGKIVILDFWYRGCGWCIRAMPRINALARKYRDESVVFLGVNKDSDLGDMKVVVESMDPAYPNWNAPKAPAVYGIRGYPTLLVLDPGGVVRRAHVGFSPYLESELSAWIDELLLGMRRKG